VINSNVHHILHCLATICAWRTDGRTDDNADKGSTVKFAA